MKKNYLLLVLFLSMVCFVSKAEWSIVYDGSDNPENLAGWDLSSNTPGPNMEEVVMDDPNYSSNKIFKYVQPDELRIDESGSASKLYRFYYENGTIADGEMTIVARLKGISVDTLTSLIEIQAHNSVTNYREYLQIDPVNSEIKFGRAGISTTVTADLNEWHIYRFVLAADSASVYLDENPTAVLHGGGGSTTGSHYFRMGDGGSARTGGYIDYVLIDTTAALLPGEGDPLPFTLMHSYDFETADTVVDVVAGANGTITGTASIAGGDYVNTSDGYITLPGADLALGTYDAVTLEAYITASAGLNTSYTMLCYFGGLTGANDFWIQPTRSTDQSAAIEADGLWLDAGFRLDDGEKHYIVGELTETTLKYYIDGILVVQGTGTGLVSQISSENAWIGHGGWPDPAWKGTLHKFNIYNGAIDITAIEDSAIAFGVLDPTKTALLTDLSVGGAELLPEFDPNVTEYVVDIPTDSTQLTISATAKWTGVVTGDGAIDVSSGSVTDTVKVTSEDGTVTTKYVVYFTKVVPGCYTPLYGDRDNIVSDPQITDVTNFTAWGNRYLNVDPDYTYCGLTSGKAIGSCGGSFDVPLTGIVNLNTTYEVKAMVYVPDSGACQIGVWGIEVADINHVSTTHDAWEEIHFTFTSGDAFGKATQGMFFNSCTGAGNEVAEAYIDNWELYELGNDATLSDILVDAVSLASFDPATLDYEILLPEGTVVVPTVTATTTDDNASASITPAAAIPGTTSIEVVSEDELDTITYTVNFDIMSIDRDVLLFTSLNDFDNPKDSLQIAWLEAEGYTVDVITETTDFYNASQGLIDSCNTSGVVIYGRAPSSSSLNGGSGYALMSKITRPVIMCGPYAARNGGWFANKGPVHYQESDAPGKVLDTLKATVLMPGDAVFSGVTLMGDSVPWVHTPEDVFIYDTMTNGDVLAVAYDLALKSSGIADSVILFERWVTGQKLFEGISAQTARESYIAAAPRTYFGMGNDKQPHDSLFFTLTPDAKVVYKAEIDRLIGADYIPEASTLAMNSNIGTITAGVGTITPTVSAGVTEYTLSVPNGTTQVIITATPEDANASVLDDSDFDGVDTVTIEAGVGQSVFTVTAEDGFATTVYTVNVEELPSTNANLSDITLDGATLNETFNAGTTSYTATPSQGSVTVTGVKEDDAASVAYSPDQTVDVSGSSQTVTITVTAEDGSTTKPYTVEIAQYVGIHTLTDAGVAIYPNPTNATLTLEGLELNTSVSVINITGKVVYSKIADQDILKLNVNSLESGLYMVKLEINGNVYTSRFVKK